jgi:hypothetical protein
MAFVAGVNQAKVNIDMAVAGQPASFGFYVEDETTLSAQRLDELASLVYNWATTQLYEELSGGTTINGVTLYDMASESAPKSSIVAGTPVAGNVGNQPLPPNVAMVVTLETGGRGRSARGRVYIPGLDEASWDGDEFSPTAAPNMTEEWDDLQTLLGVAQFRVIVSSSIENGVARPTRLAQPVTSFVAKNKPGSQRRRVRYGDGL